MSRLRKEDRDGLIRVGIFFGVVVLAFAAWLLCSGEITTCQTPIYSTNAEEYDEAVFAKAAGQWPTALTLPDMPDLSADDLSYCIHYQYDRIIGPLIGRPDQLILTVGAGSQTVAFAAVFRDGYDGSFSLWNKGVVLEGDLDRVTEDGISIYRENSATTAAPEDDVRRIEYALVNLEGYDCVIVLDPVGNADQYPGVQVDDSWYAAVADTVGQLLGE